VSHYDLQALHGQPAVQQVRAIDRYRLTIDRAFGPGMADALDRFATVLAVRPEVATCRCIRTRPTGGCEQVPERIVRAYKEVGANA
jgi:hypothetical protein